MTIPYTPRPGAITLLNASALATLIRHEDKAGRGEAFARALYRLIEVQTSLIQANADKAGRSPVASTLMVRTDLLEPDQSPREIGFSLRRFSEGETDSHMLSGALFRHDDGEWLIHT